MESSSGDPEGIARRDVGADVRRWRRELVSGIRQARTLHAGIQCQWIPQVGDAAVREDGALRTGAIGGHCRERLTARVVHVATGTLVDTQRALAPAADTAADAQRPRRPALGTQAPEIGIRPELAAQWLIMHLVRTGVAPT